MRGKTTIKKKKHICLFRGTESRGDGRARERYGVLLEGCFGKCSSSCVFLLYFDRHQRWLVPSSLCCEVKEIIENISFFASWFNSSHNQAYCSSLCTVSTIIIKINITLTAVFIIIGAADWAVKPN
jgi:hypothetical protein